MTVLVFSFGLIAHHVYLDRDNLPPLEPFIQFELPTVGRVYDADGGVLFELAREYRRVVTCEELPQVVRDAILSAEDKNFFSHSGVDYGAFPRVLWRNLARSVRGERLASGSDSRPKHGFSFSQGGSTITQQLVRGYFLRGMTNREESNILNEALEHGLRRFEERHPQGKGLIQGSAVVLKNVDGPILAEIGGRRIYRDRRSSYVDFNRASSSSRQPGSAMKPFVYLAAFQHGVTLDHDVRDEPIAVSAGDGTVKWIHNYDREFKGVIPLRQALAESRNAAATWIAEEVGIAEVLRTAKDLGIVTPLNHYISTALGASEVRLVELANAYRAIASGIVAEPHVIERVKDGAGTVLFVADSAARPLEIDPVALEAIQEGLRSVVRIPGGTAHALDSSEFPLPVMGKTGTTSEFRDALFVGSTYGPTGITVAVRIGYDDNRKLGEKETGALAAMPIFREIMLKVYEQLLVGPAPRFPEQIEQNITDYIVCATSGSPRLPFEETVPRESTAGRQPVAVYVSNEPTQGSLSATTRCASRGLAFDRQLPSDGGASPAALSPVQEAFREP